MNAHREMHRSDRIDRINRNSRWQSRIGWTCFAVAVFAAAYFAGQLLRIVL